MCNASEADTRRLSAPGRDVTISPPPMVGQGSDGPSQLAPRGPSSHRSRTPTPAATSHHPATTVLRSTNEDGVERATQGRTAGAAGFGGTCESMPLGRQGISTSGFPSGVDEEGIGAVEEQNVFVGKAKTSVTHVARTTSREVARPEKHRGTQRPQDRLSSVPDGDKGGDNHPAASLPSSIWTNLGGVDSDDSEGDYSADHGGTVVTVEHKNMGSTCSNDGNDLAQTKTSVPMDPSNSTINSEVVAGGDHAVASQEGSTDPGSEKNQSRAARENQANSGAGWAFSLMRDHDGGESDAFLDPALEDDCDLLY